ncbi:hypothetical protein J3F84DRAFT_370386, partial [Trichoderma pleuroticola]
MKLSRSSVIVFFFLFLRDPKLSSIHFNRVYLRVGHLVSTPYYCKYIHQFQYDACTIKMSREMASFVIFRTSMQSCPCQPP